MHALHRSLLGAKRLTLWRCTRFAHIHVAHARHRLQDALAFDRTTLRVPVRDRGRPHAVLAQSPEDETRCVSESGHHNIGGMTLSPGVYKWGTGLLIPSNVTLSGGSSDVWIFQVAQNLTMASATKVLLKGGAVPSS
jgi:hypothetical protein